VIDIAVNLLHPQFDDDRAEVLNRARAAGVTELLVTATDLDMTGKAIDYCSSHDLFCTAGVHPHDAKEAPADLAIRLARLASSQRVKAIGETGLDFNRNFSPPEVQQAVFEIHLEVAEEIRLPVFVHDRDSEGAVYRTLSDHADNLTGIVVHCFTGSERDLKRYLALGAHIGITGWICDERRGEELRSLIGQIPLERLLIETDAPFLLPHDAPSDWHQRHTHGASKRRNEPALLPVIAARIARELGLEAAEIEEISTENALRLFDLPVRDPPAP